ncbi:MAG: choice-of-anchor D domain-containing protein, partial [Acidimicrobiales bacterium]
VQAHSPRYGVREPRRRPRSHDENPNPVADYLAELGEADQEPDRLAEEAAAILQAVGHARELGDWKTGLRLGRAAERALTVSRRWGAWEIVLRHQLEAARALGDRRAEAWAHHQLGTRALCLDDPSGARANLARALAIRDALGDHDGSAASRHNLEHLDGPPPPPRGRDDAPVSPDGPPPPPPPPPPPRPRRGLMTAIAAATVVILVAGIAVLVGRIGDRPAARALRIQGTGYSVMIEPADVDFGEAPVGSATPPRRLTIVNTGSSPLRVGALAGIDAAAGFVVVDDACAATDLPPAGRCDVEVVFRPTAAGTRKANVAVPLPDRTQSVTFSGRGVDPAIPVPPPDVVLTTLPIVVPTTRPPVVTTTTTTTTPPEADLAVELTGRPCIRGIKDVVGTCSDKVIFTVINRGAATANNVQLSVVGQGGVWVMPECPGAPSCRWPSLANGQSVNVPVGFDIATATASASIRATVDAAERDPDPANNTSAYP